MVSSTITGIALAFLPADDPTYLLICLDRGETLIFDYADMTDLSDPYAQRSDLEARIRADAASSGRNHVDVFCITQLDDRHVVGASRLFWLMHDASYQFDDRIRIDELWVPAAAIVDDGGCSEEIQLWRAEARHRFRQGSGIRVFSRPIVLKQWAAANSVELDPRLPLFVDAGTLVPGWTLEGQGAEFFVHSPFAVRLTDRHMRDNATDKVLIHATLDMGGHEVRLITGAVQSAGPLSLMLDIAEAEGHQKRLVWDRLDLPYFFARRDLRFGDSIDLTNLGAQVRRLVEHYGRAD